MYECTYEQRDGKFVCTRCGDVRKKLVRRNCPKAPMRGLGDVVAAITSAVGIKPCGGCKERQAALNKLVPFSVGGDGAGSAGAVDAGGVIESVDWNAADAAE